MTTKRESVVLITGAASGMGRALAARFARGKIAGIALVDVNEQGLAETSTLIESLGIPVSVHVVDVSDLEQVKQLADDVIARHDRVTHLINNAGVGLIGTFEQLSIHDLEWLMGINFWGVVYGCKTFLPILKQQPEAVIVNVSSVFGLIGPEEQSAYCASKFAVRGFTESLRHELAGTNIFVTCVHPGGIKTNIVRNSKVGEDTPVEWKQQGAKLFDKIAKTSAEDAADAIVRGIEERDTRILIGKDALAISVLSRLFPKRYLKVLEWLIFPKRYLKVLEWLNGHKMSLRKK